MPCTMSTILVVIYLVLISLLDAKTSTVVVAIMVMVQVRQASVSLQHTLNSTILFVRRTSSIIIKCYMGMTHFVDVEGIMSLQLLDSKYLCHVHRW